MQVNNSRFDASPWGNGIDISFCDNVVVSKNEVARNKLSGIRCTESDHVKVPEILWKEMIKMVFHSMP